MMRRDTHVDNPGGRQHDYASDSEGAMNWQTTCALLAALGDYLEWARQEDEEAGPALSAAST